MKENTDVIARAIIDEPDVVSVRKIDGAHTSIPELKAAKTEIGKITDKQVTDSG